MARWEPDARGRMISAALDLFAEQGYDKTAAGDIAARAGVTERTFFRHFADKREVLFDGSLELDEEVARAIAEADPAATPLQAALAGARRAAVVLGDGRNREHAATRARIVAETPALKERELLKMATLTATATAALTARDVDEPAATLAAHAAIAVFQTAFGRWVSGEGEQSFAECCDEAAAELRRLM